MLCLGFDVVVASVQYGFRDPFLFSFFLSFFLQSGDFTEEQQEGQTALAPELSPWLKSSRDWLASAVQCGKAAQGGPPAVREAASAPKPIPEPPAPRTPVPSYKDVFARVETSLRAHAHAPRRFES
jgi:hypothetical protein